MLAAITSNPSRYNPISHPENNNERRQIVLQYMEEQGYIDANEREEAMGMEVYDEIQRVDELQRQSSPYTYFTDALIEQVTEDLVQDLGYTESEAYTLLYSGGLEIKMCIRDRDGHIQLRVVCQDMIGRLSLFDQWGNDLVLFAELPFGHVDPCSGIPEFFPCLLYTSRCV